MQKEITRDLAEELFVKHSAYIYRVALFLTKSRALADDIMQEAFLQIYKKYHTYDSNRPIEPWMYKIVLNITRNFMRRQKWLVFVEQVPESANISDIEEPLLKEENELELWKSINQLSQKSREIIILHYYAEMKLSDIAYALDIPLGTCKSRLNSALASLRKQLAGIEIAI